MLRTRACFGVLRSSVEGSKRRASKDMKRRGAAVAAVPVCVCWEPEVWVCGGALLQVGGGELGAQPVRAVLLCRSSCSHLKGNVARGSPSTLTWCSIWRHIADFADFSTTKRLRRGRLV